MPVTVEEALVTVSVEAPAALLVAVIKMDAKSPERTSSHRRSPFQSRSPLA